MSKYSNKFKLSVDSNLNFNQFDFRPSQNFKKHDNLIVPNINVVKQIDNIIFQDVNCIFTNSNLLMF